MNWRRCALFGRFSFYSGFWFIFEGIIFTYDFPISVLITWYYRNALRCEIFGWNDPASGRQMFVQTAAGADCPVPLPHPGNETWRGSLPCVHRGVGREASRQLRAVGTASSRGNKAVGASVQILPGSFSVPDLKPNVAANRFDLYHQIIPLFFFQMPFVIKKLRKQILVLSTILLLHTVYNLAYSIGISRPGNITLKQGLSKARNKSKVVSEDKAPEKVTKPTKVSWNEDTELSFQNNVDFTYQHLDFLNFEPMPVSCS